MFKLKPGTKEEKIKLAVDNPWNRKYSDDFMRYVKAEMFNLSNYFAKLSMNLLIAYFNPYDIAQIGDRDFYPTGIFFALLIVDNIGIIIYYLYTMGTGLQIYDDYFKKLWKIYWTLHVFIMIATFAIYFASEGMKGENK